MDRWIIDSDPGVKFPAWTRGNAADVFPTPVSPLMATLYLRQMGYGVRDAYVEMGVYDYDEMEDPADPTIFAVFGGYVYNSLSLVRLLGARMPGASPEAIDKAFFDERPDVPPYEAHPWHESERHSAKLAETMAWVMSVTALSELDRDKELADSLRAGRPELSTLDTGALLARRAKAMVPFLRQVFDTGMIVSSLASMGPGVLAAICEGLDDPTLSIRLLAGIEADSAEPPKAMWALSRHVRASSDLTSLFDAGIDGLVDRMRASTVPDTQEFVRAFDDFLYNYGSRCPNEWDVLSKSWEVQPAIVLVAIDRMRMTADSQSPTTRGVASVVERDRVVADLRSRLDDETSALFDAALRSSRLFLSGRERYKTNAIKIVGEIRMALREVGRQAVAAGHLREIDHVFMLLANELDEFQNHPDRFGRRLAERDSQHRSLYDLEPPFVVNGSVAPIDQWMRRVASTAERATAGTVLRGVAGSGGVATGRAVVILDPSDPAELEPGDVLVAPQTDPSWGPLFVPAAAVVVNVGAMGSHAMIVSRELGIPCVVSVENATGRIPTGATVTVDGNAGTVTVH